MENNYKIIDINKELKKSYLDYAMSVIISRALPDVRDGLKPVHRRILYAMNILKNDFNKPYKKSARIVGDVIGKYHPHGDTSVYEAIVRMVQNFSLRYPLIDGQGNFGSIDGDSAAAMRYTEIRMSKISHELLSDIEKDTVDFYLNYDNSEYIPNILPSKIPNLLINGTYGIAVGVATNIPPHNISEILDACLALIKNNDLSIDEIMKYIPGPDFPTAGIIYGKNDIKNIYKTGKGKICVRSKIEIVKNKKDKNKFIIIKEIPYQVNKIKLIEKISNLIKEKKVLGINNIKDESNQKGIRIIIEINKDYSEKIILNNLYVNTQLESHIYINMVALCNQKPKLMSLKSILYEFIKHRENIIYRKTKFLLNECNKKINIVEGFLVTINNIELIIKIIKKSYSTKDAKNNLINIKFKLNNDFILLKNKYNKIISDKNYNEKDILNYYNFNEQQIKSILDLKLQRLTNLENKNLFDEYNLLINNIKNYINILNNKNEIQNIIYNELLNTKNLYKDKRLTKIIDKNITNYNKISLIKKIDIIITITYFGYIKCQLLSDYQYQKRGGKGKLFTKIKSEDFINCLLMSNTHDNIYLFSNKGKMYKLKAYDLPLLNKNVKGKLISTLIKINKDEKITYITTSLKLKNDKNYIIIVTLNGFIKKTSLKELIKLKNSGFIVIKLNKNDEIVDAKITEGNNDIMLFSQNGKVIRFSEKYIRNTSRMSYGVKGMILSENDKISSLIISKNSNNQILTITKNGFGKRTNKNEYPIKSRATHGVISNKITDKSGKLIKSIEIDNDKDEILIITDNGNIIRTKVNEIRISSRNTSGVKIIKILKNESVMDLKKITNCI